MNQSLAFLCPIEGILLEIKNIPDPTFAEGLLGPGFAINPFHGKVVAPFDSCVVQIHPSHHALTLQHESGIELLIHLGIDTVQLKGRGFHLHCKEKQKVRAGDPLITWDLDLCGMAAKSLISAFVFLKNESFVEMNRSLFSQVVQSGHSIGQIKTELQSSNSTTEPTQNAEGRMSASFALNLPQGMHARPAARITQFAKQLRDEFYLVKGSEKAALSSVTRLLSLNIQAQDAVTLWTANKKTPEFEKTLSFLKTLQETELNIAHPPPPQIKNEQISYPENVLVGLCASPGMARGYFQKWEVEHMAIPQDNEGSEKEKAKWQEALTKGRAQLRQLTQSSDRKSQEIFSAHLELLDDPHILNLVQSLIQKGESAAQAWKNAFETFAAELSQSKNHFLAERATDLRDLGLRVLSVLLNKETSQEVNLKGKILFADEITPSQVLQFSQAGVTGLFSSRGGVSGHAAILARSLQIPFLVNVNLANHDLNHNLLTTTELLINGFEGTLTFRPSLEQITTFEKAQLQRETNQRSFYAAKDLPAVTKDGRNIEVAANMGSAEDATLLGQSGADGIGLLRTEFIFIEQDVPPSVEVQKTIYQTLAASIPQKNFVVRTLDIGGDKHLSYLDLPKEENPFLGVRGIRLSLKHSELFETQLRALAKTTHSGKLSIMFPMVTEVSEFLIAKEKALQIFRSEKSQQAVDFGIMIEVPSAALTAEAFAPHVDFFSIGTNDLSQYTLAMDRGNHELAQSLDAAHPAVLRLIAMTVQSGQKFKKWVGVCGNFASDTAAVPLLIGLGVDELSVSLPSVPEVKALVRCLDLSECQRLANKCLNLPSATEVRKLLRTFQSQQSQTQEIQL